MDPKHLRIGIPDLESFDPHRGIGRMITHLVAYWRRWGHDVISLRSRRSRLPVLRNTKWGIKSPLNGIDVIYVPNFLDEGVLFYTLNHFPGVVTIHDLGYLDCAADRFRFSLLTGLMFRLALRSACQASHIVVDSNFTLRRLLYHTHLAEPRVTTVYLGVDVSVFHPQDRQTARDVLQKQGVLVGQDDYLLIYVGEEYPRKNLPVLLQAFGNLRSQWPTARLIKVGRAHNPSDRQVTMESIQQTGLSNNLDVWFIDDADDEFLATLYSASNLFVSTSLYEGFGLPLLEALACGLPAVVSRAGSLPEIGADTAICIDPTDVQGFSNALLANAVQGQQPPSPVSLARAAEFSWENTARAYLNILISASRK